jgi:murein DD-endopeptidase MepM/ murein hydrolase activator NlpD
VEHKNGYETLYGHLSSLNVKEGQYVKSGNVIGFAGSTGRSTGPHLHYEILKNNQNVDPARYLSLR